MSRLRQRLLFERFLVRVFALLGDTVLLKGGVVLELRLSRARATRDVDLRCTGQPNDVLARLREAGRSSMEDLLLFEVGDEPRGHTIQGESMVYEGRRFRAQARLDGRPYGEPFGVDVAFGDVLVGAPEVIEGSDFLAFAGLPRSKLRVYPREAHVAEKLHAYTLPRERENSRVKDLPDLALLAQTGSFDGRLLRIAFEKTFSFRRTHSLPVTLPRPPASWEAPYKRMARDDGLPWRTLEGAHRAARAFVEPVLSGNEEVWNPDSQVWQTRGATERA